MGLDLFQKHQEALSTGLNSYFYYYRDSYIFSYTFFK